MLEIHCAWQNLIYWKKIYCQKNWENGPTKGFFEFIERFGHEFLLNVFYIETWYFLLCSSTNPICGKASWDIGQNTLWQSDYSIFKSTIFPERIYEITWFFAFWYVTKTKRWLKFLGWAWSKTGAVGMVMGL